MAKKYVRELRIALYPSGAVKLDAWGIGVPAKDGEPSVLAYREVGMTYWGTSGGKVKFRQPSPPCGYYYYDILREEGDLVVLE